MYNVMITGAGKIGSLIACLLSESGSYQVHLVDIDFNGSDVKRLLDAVPKIKTVALDVRDQQSTQAYIGKKWYCGCYFKPSIFPKYLCC